MGLESLAEDVPEGDFPHHHGRASRNHLHVAGEVDEGVAPDFLVEHGGAHILRGRGQSKGWSLP